MEDDLEEVVVDLLVLVRAVVVGGCCCLGVWDWDWGWGWGWDEGSFVRAEKGGLGINSGLTCWMWDAIISRSCFSAA